MDIIYPTCVVLQWTLARLLTTVSSIFIKFINLKICLLKMLSWYYFGDYTLNSEHWEHFPFSLKYIFHGLIEIYDENNYPHK